ncbi:hypothetical protein, partial [Zwartia vadi]|uniref:hypothetical protein n=1 Tax=Zwartia vadi TaxID=3058168 RepID=UPI0025B56A2B
FVRFPQNPNNLFIAVSRLLHLPLTLEEAIVSSYLGSKKLGQVTQVLYEIFVHDYHKLKIS